MYILYIDRKMRDHGLFQVICRVNRLDGDTKEFGYIVDYQQLFGDLTDAVSAYTSVPLKTMMKKIKRAYKGP